MNKEIFSNQLSKIPLESYYLSRFSIIESMRGSGLANKIMEDFIYSGRKYPNYSLHAKASNERAIRFYIKNDFSQYSNEKTDFLSFYRNNNLWNNLQKILQHRIKKSNLKFDQIDHNFNLLSTGFVDSFEFLDIISELEQKSGISVDISLLNDESLGTLDSLIKLFLRPKL